MTAAADAVCDADVVAKYVRTDMKWDLLTIQSLMNIRVASLCQGSIGFPGFPEWLGKNSNASKRARLLGELTMHIRASKAATNLDRRALRLDYLPAMRTIFVTPLCGERGVEDVPRINDYLDDYSMNRDDLFETMAELQFGTGESSSPMPGFRDVFSGISPQTKAAFTREYNKRPHKSQILVAEEVVNKTSSSKKRKASALSGEGVEDEVDDDDDDDDDNKMILEAFKPKKRPFSSSRSKSAPINNSSSCGNRFQGIGNRFS